MQRVAIARALVGDPDILLADEPTGALDSETSRQIMDILQNIAQTRLVIMVTHNAELAKRYSTRIIQLLDGELLSDSNPPHAEDRSADRQACTSNRRPAMKKVSMSLLSATALSLKNLFTKKGRTATTAFAGSIGILGVALVLALSSGLSSYMADMQAETLSGYPITVTTEKQTIAFVERTNSFLNNINTDYQEFPEGSTLYRNETNAQDEHLNTITDEYLTYVEGMRADLGEDINSITYHYGTGMNILARYDGTVVKFESQDPKAESDHSLVSSLGAEGFWQEMPENAGFVMSQYDLIGEHSRLPQAENELAIVVDEYNRLDDSFLSAIGISDPDDEYRAEDFIGKTLLKVVDNDSYYFETGGLYAPAQPSQYEELWNEGDGVALTVVGVLRIKEDAASAYFSKGFVYTPELTSHVVSSASDSSIADAQAFRDTSVVTGTAFQTEEAKSAMLSNLGADAGPVGISIYPVSFDAKETIKASLDAYNDQREPDDQVVYSDMAETVTSVTATLLDTVSYVLVGFAAISLVVSTIMVSIVTYVSVMERTKEIGILRSVGARKKDIAHVFNAETLVIGFAAGLLGVGIAFALQVPINMAIEGFTGIAGIASLNLAHAALLVLGSMALTLVAGLVPAQIAARKDPVEALRSE